MISNGVWNLVYSRTLKLFNNKTPKVSVTKSQKNQTPTELPNINIALIDATSRFKTLNQTSDNGCYVTFEIKSNSNTSLNEAAKNLDSVLDLMLSMGFTVNTQVENSTSIWTMVARVSRLVGSAENLL